MSNNSSTYEPNKRELNHSLTSLELIKIKKLVHELRETNDLGLFTKISSSFDQLVSNAKESGITLSHMDEIKYLAGKLL